MNCTVCGTTNTKTYKKNVSSVYSSKQYSIDHCGDCNHYFTSPAASSRELTRIYKNSYGYEAHDLIAREKIMRARNYAKKIAGLRGVKRVLEIGCMHGILLEEMQKQGLIVEAVERSKEAVQVCLDKGLKVSNEPIESFFGKRSAKMYDAIVMSHVLEHIEQPAELLRNIRSRLHKNGKLILIVPNSRSLTKSAFGKYWGYWQVPVHINHFNNDSLTTLTKQAGFQITQTKYFGADSLFFLSSLANVVGSQAGNENLSFAKKMAVRLSTIALQPWYFIGNEDMFVVARKQEQKKSNAKR